MAAAAVVPLLAYGAVSILSLRTGARQAVIVGNPNVSRQADVQIELYLIGIVKIQKAAAAELDQSGWLARQQVRLLKNYVLQLPEFRELTVLDYSGRLIVSSSLGVPTANVPGSDSVNL